MNTFFLVSLSVIPEIIEKSIIKLRRFSILTVLHLAEIHVRLIVHVIAPYKYTPNACLDV